MDNRILSFGFKNCVVFAHSAIHIALYCDSELNEVRAKVKLTKTTLIPTYNFIPGMFLVPLFLHNIYR